MSGDGPDATRLALLSDWALVGHAVAVALDSRSLVPVTFEWPTSPGRLPTLRRQIASSGARVGLVLSDLESPDRIRDLRQVLTPEPVRWLVLTDTAPDARWGGVIEAGAIGLMALSSNLDQIMSAIAAVLSGWSPTPAPLRERVVAEWHELAEEQQQLALRLGRLTVRELDVLVSLHEGHTVREIAEASNVSESTVRGQVREVREKLEVTSQLAAVATYHRAIQLIPGRRGASSGGSDDRLLRC